MKVAIIGEGQTEYYCLPKFVGRLGHVVVGQARIVMPNPEFNWERLFELRIVPLVHAMLTKNPDKILMVLDKEHRPDCCPELARRGLAVIAQHCGHCLGCCQVGVVISDMNFESVLFADYEVVDQLTILESENVSSTFPPSTDGQNVLPWISHSLKPGHAYQKIRDGMFLAKRIQLTSQHVQARNRSLRKLVHEL